MTEVVETLEQDHIEPLEGTHESPQHKTRIFRTLSALANYIDAFKIEGGQWGSGILQSTGEKVYQLTYISYQGE